MTEEQSIEDIIKSIRSAILEKEQKEYFAQFMVNKQPKAIEDVFELKKNMIVKREDIPYKLGIWSYEDVAKKMMKKFNYYFGNHCRVCLAESRRVSVKEDPKTLNRYSSFIK